MAQGNGSRIRAVSEGSAVSESGDGEEDLLMHYSQCFRSNAMRAIPESWRPKGEAQYLPPLVETRGSACHPSQCPQVVY